MKYDTRTPLSLTTCLEGRNVTVRGITYPISHRQLVQLTDDIIRDWAVHCLMDEVIDEAMELDIEKTLTKQQIADVADFVFEDGQDGGFWEAIIDRGCPMHEQGIRDAVGDCSHWDWQTAFEDRGLFDPYADD